MKKGIGIGIDDFRKIIKEDCYYFDKTHYIEELLKDRKGKVKSLFTNLGKVADISIYNKTKGLFDTKTLIATGFLIYGLKKLKSEMLLPSGATLIWWSYRLLSRDRD